MKKKIDIRQLSLDNLTDEIVKLGEKPYRAQQIHDWLWKKRAINFDQMTNLSIDSRDLLKNTKAISNNKKNTKALQNAISSDTEGDDEGGAENPCDKYPEAC